MLDYLIAIFDWLAYSWEASVIGCFIGLAGASVHSYLGERAYRQNFEIESIRQMLWAILWFLMAVWFKL